MNQDKTPHTESRQRLGTDLNNMTHSSLGSLVESPVLLFRDKHPYNLGSGVTNVHLKLANNQL